MRAWPTDLTLADFVGTFKIIRNDGSIDLAADAQGLHVEAEGARARVTFFNTTAAGAGPPDGEHLGELVRGEIVGKGFTLKAHGAIHGKKRVLVLDTGKDAHPRPFQDWEAGEG